MPLCLQNRSNFNQKTLNSTKKKLEFAKLEKFTFASSDFVGAGVRPTPVGGNRQQRQPQMQPCPPAHTPRDPPNAAPKPNNSAGALRRPTRSRR